MKILAIDIETRPSLAYVWKLWDENVGLDQLVDSGEMISFAAKWVGEPEVTFLSVYHDTKKKMVKSAWKLLDEADVVMHYNGKKFDIPHIQREFLEAGMTPPSPFKQIDLMTTCKSQFRFPSNKLAYVADRLGIGKKIQHEGFKLWLKCMERDANAWERMKEYNIQDTLLLEELYEKIKPWIRQHPSFAAFLGEHVCPKCEGTNLQKRGFETYSTGTYQRLRCNDCGGWSRITTRSTTTDIVSI